MNRIVRDDVKLSDNVALRDDRGQEMSYLELYYESEGLTQYLEARSLIMVLCDHHIDTLAFLYEVMTQNRIPLLLGADVYPEFLEHLMDIYRPQYIYCGREYWLTEEYVCVKEWSFHVLLRTGWKQVPVHPDVALLLSTSGTTGSPKLVKLSYKNLYSNAAATVRYLGFEAGQKGITPLPLNFAYGFSFCLAHWYTGAVVLTTEHSVISRAFRDFCRKEQIHHFAAAPAVFRMLDRIDFWKGDFGEYLRLVISAGAPMAEEEIAKLNLILGNRFWVGYGQTECTGLVTAISTGDAVYRQGTIGKAFSNVDIHLQKDNNELLIGSDSVCMGYATCAEQLNEGDVNKGIIHTGDLAAVDENSCVYLKGRIARFIKILGKRVSLDEIEKYLRNQYKGIEFACKGADDELHVYYSCTENDVFMKTLLMFLDEAMKIPARFVQCHQISEIPVNASGKIQYAQLGGTNGNKDTGNM